MDEELHRFRYDLLRNGMQYDENDAAYLLKVAKECVKQAGIPMGGAGAVMLAGAGSVTIPGIGAVPGYAAGFLAGLIGGTTMCTLSRVAIKRDLDKLLED